MKGAPPSFLCPGHPMRDSIRGVLIWLNGCWFAPIVVTNSLTSRLTRRLFKKRTAIHMERTPSQTLEKQS
jgi:hypothetical protein